MKTKIAELCKGHKLSQEDCPMQMLNRYMHFAFLDEDDVKDLLMMVMKNKK